MLCVTYAEYLTYKPFMLIVIVLNVVMLSFIMPSVIASLRWLILQFSKLIVHFILELS
jgi:hypothetical protein